jgi:hypothetical protein
MAKTRKKWIWELVKAGKSGGAWAEWDLAVCAGDNRAVKKHYSSLEKCRQIVKDVVESHDEQIGSIDNWTEEQWREDGNYCIVINSGGCGIFSFRKIYYE